MKGLLHSKKFKKNLKKWLYMYVGTLLLLTTVVTYSKYISNLGGNDTARITKFNVVIDKEDSITETCSDTLHESTPCCTGTALEGNLSCKTSNFRPTEEMAYEFTVKPDVEVNTFLAVTITTTSDFDIIKVIDITDNHENGAVLYNIETSGEQEKKVYTINSNLNMTDLNPNIIKKYRVIVKYNKYDGKTYSKTAKENIEVINVGYSANQDR